MPRRMVKRLLVPLLAQLSRALAAVITTLAPLHGRSVLPLPPPYAYVQDDLVRHLPEYLHTTAPDIGRIVIVGAWHGDEVEEMLRRFENCRLLLLEPSNDAWPILYARFGANPQVTCRKVAAADRNGTSVFHETNVTGNGSLLPLAEAGDRTFTVPGIAESAAYEVETVRLDDLPELSDDQPVDCLWIDVQGFELSVLRGGPNVLDRVRAAFIEVATEKVSYAGATWFEDLHELMSTHGFRLAGLGTDPANGQGNALWLKRDDP